MTTPDPAGTNPRPEVPDEGERKDTKALLGDIESARNLAAWIEGKGEKAVGGLVVSIAPLLRRLADEVDRLTRDRAELVEALEGACESLQYDQQLYVREVVELARAALSRATGEPAPAGAKGGERG